MSPYVTMSVWVTADEFAALDLFLKIKAPPTAHTNTTPAVMNAILRFESFIFLLRSNFYSSLIFQAFY